MAYIVAWSDIENIKKDKKNQLFKFDRLHIQHDMYEIKKRKSDAIRRYNGLLKTNVIAVCWGKLEELTIQK
jgi:hypothetical protein